MKCDWCGKSVDSLAATLLDALDGGPWRCDECRMRGHCNDCGGPCKGHTRDFCDARWPEVKCTHPPGSRRCDHTTLHDDDETSEQAREAKRLKTRRYSKDA